jgi:uncharacterized protein DUF1579
MKRTSLAIFAALVCASAPFAIGQVSAQQAGASSQAGTLDRFVGNGTCSGKSLGADMKSFHATTGKYSGEKTLDGNWVVIRYDEDQSAAVPKPFHVVQYFGYDKANKRYVSVLVDNSGSGYSTGASTGWKGDSISFDESMAGQPVAFRDSFTSNNGMSSHTGTMRDKSGKWVKTDEESCKS